jgi:hypothetical protein
MIPRDLKDIQEMPNEVGLWENYCFNCEQVTVGLEHSAGLDCSICGQAIPGSKLALFIRLLIGGGLTICLTIYLSAMLFLRFRSK